MTDSEDRIGTDILVTCGACEKPVMARVSGVLIERNDEKGPPTLFQLASCQRCGEALLALEEDYGNGWDGEPVTVWPQPRQVLSPFIPEALRNQHTETHKCLSVKAYIATVVMNRRTLEGICKDQGAQGRNLMRMLEELAASGIIEGRLLEWSQELRILGNEGAHFTETTVTADDAIDAIAFTEALMDYIYVYSAQFANFKQRRAGGQIREP
ncbi:DUF4145 domain-containing protein [Streptomyces globisporus]